VNPVVCFDMGSWDGLVGVYGNGFVADGRSDIPGRRL
jgi:hypothetical protein